jgi:MoxR-like ATPase
MKDSKEKLGTKHRGKTTDVAPPAAGGKPGAGTAAGSAPKSVTTPPPKLSAASPRLSNEDAAIVARLRAAHEKVKREMAKVIVGQQEIIDHLLIGLLCRGHILLLGLPGLGKTLMARTLARTLDLEFRRVQFTPDLMPADITGTDVIKEDQAGVGHRLEFMRGPIFTNFLLADEINRTPPKTQAALLQAMQEYEVSVGRQTYELKLPFYVVATQNPIELEGTYPLPEAQLDRFMFNLKVKYPSLEEEVQIVKETTTTRTAEAATVMKSDELLRLQDLVRGVPIADSVVRYAARLVAATRPETAKSTDSIHKYIAYGASPRASQYLVLGGKGRAILAGRYHVDFADIRALAESVLRHRLVLNFHARADGLDSDTLIGRLLKAVPQEE